jgi:hypothetical protein
MAARVLCLMTLLAVVLLGGCSGGNGVPVLIPGDYFPLPVGAVWVYNTVLQAETQTDSFSTTGTMTRTLVGTEDLQIGPDLVTAFVFQHDYTTNGVPAFGAASQDVAPFINHLFSANGGLHSVRAYYRIGPRSPDLSTQIDLVAVSRVGEPVVRLVEPRPFLFNPPYQGTAQSASLWFTPMPLMPFASELSRVEQHDKTLNYGGSGGIGDTQNLIISIYYYGADLTVGGEVAAIAGRGRNFYKNGIGLWGYDVQSDWYGTINVGGETSRVTSRLELISYTPPGL